MCRFLQFPKNVLLSITKEIKLLSRGSRKAPSCSLSIDDVVESIKRQDVKRIVVLSGAGLSTASGVPDFRTPGSGLYDNLASYNIPYPEAIFEINYFLQNPRPFYSVAKQLCSMGQYKPNYAHYFISLLHEKEVLLRLYTQNIDGLERSSGIPESKLIEAHGSFNTGTCTLCRHQYHHEDVQQAIKMAEPFCKKPKCKGIIKPDVVFFGENLHERFYTYIDDLKICDLLLVMGTSLETKRVERSVVRPPDARSLTNTPPSLQAGKHLHGLTRTLFLFDLYIIIFMHYLLLCIKHFAIQVYPFAAIVEETKPNCPRVLFNRDIVGPFTMNLPNDVVIKGDLIEGLMMFADKLGWQDDMNNIMMGKS